MGFVDEIIQDDWPEGYQLASAMNFRFQQVVATPMEQVSIVRVTVVIEITVTQLCFTGRQHYQQRGHEADDGHDALEPRKTTECTTVAEVQVLPGC